jgi:flavin-dependent dehydrogenase
MSEKLEQLERELEDLRQEYDDNNEMIVTLKRRQEELKSNWGHSGLIQDKKDEILFQKQLEFWLTLPELVPLPSINSSYDHYVRDFSNYRFLKKTPKRFYVISQYGRESYATLEAPSSRDTFYYSQYVDRTQLP